MLFGYWIGGAIDAPLKHLGLFLEGRSLAHGQLTVICQSRRGGQAFPEAPVRENLLAKHTIEVLLYGGAAPPRLRGSNSG
jgi:hypothetical protein